MSFLKKKREGAVMSRDELIPPTPSEAEHRESEAHREREGAEAIFHRDDPFALFTEWLAMANEREPNDPNAMALATAGADGSPDVRMVLLKGFDEEGFVFYSNTESEKGRQLEANPQAGVCFHWKSLRRQVRVRGPVSPVSAAEADAYFSERARESRIGAWASQQSRPLESREALQEETERYAAEFADGEIPRPPYWSGYRLAPLRIEFWRDRAFRLHDRLVFTRASLEAPWRTMRLYP